MQLLNHHLNTVNLDVKDIEKTSVVGAQLLNWLELMTKYFHLLQHVNADGSPKMQMRPSSKITKRRRPKSRADAARTGFAKEVETPGYFMNTL